MKLFKKFNIKIIKQTFTRVIYTLCIAFNIFDLYRLYIGQTLNTITIGINIIIAIYFFIEAFIVSRNME
jgi:hypothetical protein